MLMIITMIYPPFNVIDMIVTITYPLFKVLDMLFFLDLIKMASGEILSLRRKK